MLHEEDPQELRIDPGRSSVNLFMDGKPIGGGYVRSVSYQGGDGGFGPPMYEIVIAKTDLPIKSKKKGKKMSHHIVDPQKYEAEVIHDRASKSAKIHMKIKGTETWLNSDGSSAARREGAEAPIFMSIPDEKMFAIVKAANAEGYC